ncbi:hypothetical protein PJL18_04198 [Paenarthrobacter nicotinovorans]|nr:hypothetical protein [Paenarthrobacter nicotinovorans]
MPDGLVELFGCVLAAEHHYADGCGIEHRLEIDTDGLHAEAGILETLRGKEVAVLVLQGVLGVGQPFPQCLQGGGGVERCFVDDLVTGFQGGIQSEGYAAVAAHCIAPLHADLLDDRQRRVEGPAGGDHDVVPLGDHCLGSGANLLSHVAVMVNQGAIYVQGDHELGVFVGLVIDASNWSISQNSHASSRPDTADTQLGPAPQRAVNGA